MIMHGCGGRPPQQVKRVWVSVSARGEDKAGVYRAVQRCKSEEVTRLQVVVRKVWASSGLCATSQEVKRVWASTGLCCIADGEVGAGVCLAVPSCVGEGNAGRVQGRAPLGKYRATESGTVAEADHQGVADDASHNSTSLLDSV
jgi:hypothetical protein